MDDPQQSSAQDETPAPTRARMVNPDSGSQVSIDGVCYDVVDGVVEVPTVHVATLQSFGFSVVVDPETAVTDTTSTASGGGGRGKRARA